MANGRRCDYCSNVGPSDAKFCPSCGRPYDRGVQPPGADVQQIDLSMWTAIKLGFGLVAGAMLFGVLVFAVIALIGVGLLHRTF